jgi:plasmid stability protein
MTIDPMIQQAGVQAASAKRSREAEERKALKQALAEHPLSTPENVRDYLQIVLRSVATGALEARAGAACASIASRLIASFSIAISKELDELRAAREASEKAQYHTGSQRRNR